MQAGDRRVKNPSIHLTTRQGDSVHLGFSGRKSPHNYSWATLARTNTVDSEDEICLKFTKMLSLNGDRLRTNRSGIQSPWIFDAHIVVVKSISHFHGQTKETI